LKIYAKVGLINEPLNGVRTWLLLMEMIWIQDFVMKIN